MKRLLSGITILFVFTASLDISAQCSDKGFIDGCKAALDKFIFIKAFDINDTNAEYSYVFSKGTTYVITTCEKNTNEQLIVELYDRTRKKVASNFDKKSKKYNSKIGYQCQATGVYYMKYYFADGSKDCGMSMIGFVKK